MSDADLSFLADGWMAGILNLAFGSLTGSGAIRSLRLVFGFLNFPVLEQRLIADALLPRIATLLPVPERGESCIGTLDVRPAEDEKPTKPG